MSSSTTRSVNIAAAMTLVTITSGCAGRYAKTNQSGGTTDAAPKRGIEAAGLPFSILDARTGRQVETSEFWQRISASQIVCVGEEHKNPHHHWAQLEVIKNLQGNKQWTSPGLGMEMFQRPFQGVLDDYAAAKIDDAALLTRSGWEERWSYDFGMYRPQIRAAVDAKGALLALNAARELTKKAVRQGLESLTPEEKANVPELKLDDAAHRAWFDGVMSEMSGGPHTASPHTAPAPEPAPAPPASSTEGPAAPAVPSMDRVYAVQVMWDETMADTAAKWVSADASRHLVIIAGTGHCHDSAIINRAKRRGIARAISVQPIVETGEGEVAAVLAKPMNDYLLVMTIPPAPVGK
jgi:uncharacterized iron-regulated protein